MRPLLREVFASCEVPLDLQAWLFGVGLHSEAMTSVAETAIYKYHLGLNLGFMVVGVMTGRGVLPLIKVPSKVKVNSEFYIECVLKPVIEQLKDLYPGEMDKVFLHHDKASSHTSNKTQQFLQEMKDTLGLNFIRNSDIPVKSPDASPLDFYGFGMLKQRLFNRRPKTEAGLWKAAQEEWSNVSLSKVKEVFAAWKVRCREIAKKKGKHIEHMKKIHVRKIKF
ncbi:IKK1 [Cordylochernes scorpioides]|uniref:IKK1 n=1 Tax=Cordylochernes scorpioides TaxID=51811 RepID=A0ABY6KB59_9ARAC|nr:IKK1 [Cordylochernes scorpioides]